MCSWNLHSGQGRGTRRENICKDMISYMEKITAENGNVEYGMIVEILNRVVVKSLIRR